MYVCICTAESERKDVEREKKLCYAGWKIPPHFFLLFSISHLTTANVEKLKSRMDEKKSFERGGKIEIFPFIFCNFYFPLRRVYRFFYAFDVPR
jgi:hypothetical protein